MFKNKKAMMTIDLAVFALFVVWGVQSFISGNLGFTFLYTLAATGMAASIVVKT